MEEQTILTKTIPHLLTLQAKLMVPQIDFTTSLCAVGFGETAYRRVTHCVQTSYREHKSAWHIRGASTSNQ